MVNLAEVAASESAGEAASRLWLRGGFPRSYLAASDEDSFAWRRQAIASHVELDLPQFGINIAAPAMLRFWRMLAHVHGQVWSAADPARSLGVSEPTVRRYLDTLTQTLMVRQLQPWHANLAKRQVKSPKVYFRDSGFLHALMDVTTLEQLLSHPRCGASWEGFALEQVLRLARPDEAFFWATHQWDELDLRPAACGARSRTQPRGHGQSRRQRREHRARALEDARAAAARAGPGLAARRLAPCCQLAHGAALRALRPADRRAALEERKRDDEHCPDADQQVREDHAHQRRLA